MNGSPLPRIDLLGPASAEAVFYTPINPAEVAVLCFPTEKSHRENKVMALVGDQARIVNPANLSVDPDAVYLAYYIYEGDTRQHGVTDWAVDCFRDHYGDAIICQSDIFYYVYAMLYHPAQVGRRIPLLEEFWTIGDAGRSLTAVHLFPGEDDVGETERIANTLPPISA